MIIFAKIWTEKWKLSYIFRIWVSSHFCNIYLHVKLATRCDFFHNLLRMIPQWMTVFFCTMYTLQFFPLITADNSEEGEKLSLSKSIF